MSPLDWMFIGYTAMFGAIVLYVANLGRRQQAVQREIDLLRAALDAQEAGDASSEVGRAVAPASSPQSL